MSIKGFQAIPQTAREWNEFLLKTQVTPSDDSVSTDVLKDNSVATAKLIDAAVTSAKLATDAVTTQKIQANAVTLPKLALAASDGLFLTRRSGATTYDAIADGDLPASITRDTELTAAIAALSSVYAAIQSSGSFTITLTGLTATVTGTAFWSKVGHLVSLYLPALTGTSNATSATLTGAPAALFPARAQRLYGPVTDSGSLALGTVQVETTGVVTLGTGLALGAFTNTGTKSVSLQTLSYSLD